MMQPHGLLLCFTLLHMSNSSVSASLVGYVLYSADLMSAICIPYYYLMVHSVRGPFTHDPRALPVASQHNFIVQPLVTKEWNARAF